MAEGWVDRESWLVGVVGQTRFGKTSTLRRILYENVLEYPEKIFIVHASGPNHNQFLRYKRIRVDGGWKIEHWEQSLPYSMCSECRTLEEVIPTWEEEQKPIIIVNGPRISHAEFLQYAMGDYLGDSMRSNWGGCTLVMDEMNKYVKGHSKRLPKELMELVDEGAHYKGYWGRGVSLIWSYKRFVEVPDGIYGNSQTLFVHKLGTERQLNLLQKWSTEDYDWSAIRNLGRGEFVRFEHNAPYEPEQYLDADTDGDGAFLLPGLTRRGIP